MVTIKRIRLLAALLLAAATGWPAPALAHGPEASTVKARLEALPPALRGVKVQVQTTVAPQLVVENSSTKTLEILDRNGRAFLRIGADGVRADLASPAWYQTQTAARGVPIPGGVGEHAPPHWARVHSEPHWGWFDTRLRTDGIEVPHDVEHAGRPASLSAWSIPVRFDGEPATLQGTFRYQPLPEGVMVSRLTSSPQPAPGVRVSLAPGTVPALFVRNDGKEPVMVLNASGQPYLRIGPDGTAANAAAPRQPPRWVKISDVPRHAWTEPRATYASLNPPEAIRQAGKRALVTQWSVPMTRAGEPMAVSGEVYWQPQAERLANAGGGHGHH
ncbi:hypothetical protein [Alloalcanivorax mobilis]|uniref:hypothetical protein n=1 Tax=Alloalcanivorax mobilis TaxID=2019569 RepID=UPI000C789EF3|nr:hypothetical protein [Alloalcanivorax mobilis]